MYLCQHGVTLKYVSSIEIVIIGGAQFKNMLNFGIVPLYREIAGVREGEKNNPKRTGD